jgi:hypothetical protein
VAASAASSTPRKATAKAATGVSPKQPPKASPPKATGASPLKAKPKAKGVPVTMPCCPAARTSSPHTGAGRGAPSPPRRLSPPKEKQSPVKRELLNLLSPSGSKLGGSDCGGGKRPRKGSFTQSPPPK